jgi:membrane protein DedA with SNARE-associated domain
MFDLINSVTDWYMSHINYGTITILMAIESSFIPFPSEIVIPPAAWKAAQGELNVFLVAAFGTLGALIGALFNYYISYFLGRKIIYSLSDTKLAHLMMINRQSVEKAERYFIKNGNISTLIGRLVPAVRQLISIPAGLARMKMKPFLLYTLLGSGIWNIILTVLGYSLYSQKELLESYYKEISYGFLILGLLFVAYLIFKAFRKNGLKTSPPDKGQ